VERWRGWREVERPGCSHGETGFCEPYTLDAGETTTIEWDWLDERTARPDHYAYTGDFVTETRSVYEPGVWPLPQAEHVESVYEYALWTQTLEGASFDAPPGPMPFQQGPRSNLYPDPEAVDTALLDIESTRSRRMRASHASPMPLVQSHFEVKVNVNVPCPTFPIGWLARDMVGAWLRDYLRPAGDITLPDVWRSGPLQPPRPWVLVQGVSKRFDSVMLLPQGAVDWRNVAAPAQLPWLAETVGHAAVLRPAEPGGNGSPGSTHVLWLEDGGRQRWALVEMDLATGLTEFIAQGILDEPAFEACRLVHDRLGLVAVLVDVARGGIRVFDRELRAWAPRRVDVRALAAYEDAAMAVLGTKLVVAGGRTGGGMLVDLFGGQPQPFDGPPRRLGARLDVASDGSALLFYGGVDSAGDRPDDVWRIALSNPAPVAELLWRATGSRQPAEDLAVMTGSADGGHVYFHSIVPSDVPSVHTVVRTDRGWFETDESGQPTVPAGQ
jgi:hypothetical protein